MDPVASGSQPIRKEQPCLMSTEITAPTRTPSQEKKECHPPRLQVIFPTISSQIPTEIIAGITLVVLEIHEVLGYTKLASLFHIEWCCSA
jgi:hypothetical protein